MRAPAEHDSSVSCILRVSPASGYGFDPVEPPRPYSLGVFDGLARGFSRWVARAAAWLARALSHAIYGKRLYVLAEAELGAGGSPRRLLRGAPRDSFAGGAALVVARAVGPSGEALTTVNIVDLDGEAGGRPAAVAASRAKILAVVYRHPRMAAPLAMEVPTEMCVAGNQVLSREFVLRWLSYNAGAGAYVFDMEYSLSAVVLSRLAVSEVALTSAQHLELEADGYRVASR